MEEISREKLNIQFRIRAVDNFSKTMNKLHTRLESVKRHVDSIDDKVIVDVDVVGDMKAKRDLKKVERAAESVQRKNVLLMVKADVNQAWSGFRGLMGRIAHLSRDVSELFTSMFGSAIMASAPALAASLWSVVGVLGTLGPMVGALSGGLFGLATALGVAGIAAAGFGAVAFPSIKKVFDANSKLKDLQEQLGDTDDPEERARIMAEMASITNGLTKGQKKSLDAVNSLGDSFTKLSDSFEPQSMYVFYHTISMLEDLLGRITPMIEEAAKAAVNLTDSLRFTIETDDFNKFIDFLNTSAAPIMQDIFKGLGNFTMGLVNMMTAFGPLAGVVAKGFNNMGRDFRKWADGLSESEKFNKFVDYVKTEGPKVLSVFGGLFLGLVDMFAGFGPLASDLLDELLLLIGGFREWASTLDENEGFQNFIEFVRSNGPSLMEFFGEFREFLIRIIDGFAQASDNITPFITSLLELANALLEANPWFMEAVAWLSSLAGVALLILVPFRLFWAIIKMIIKPIMTLVGWLGQKLVPVFQSLYATWVNRVIPALSNLWQWFLRAGPTLGRVAGYFLRFITGPIGWIISGILLLAQIFDVSWSDIWNVTKKIWTKISDWIVEKVEKAIATGVIISAWVSEVIGYFGDLWNGVKESMGDIWDNITGTWDEVIGFLKGIDLWDIGASIIQGLVNGIMSIDLKGVVSGLASKLPSWIKGPLGIKSPSKVTTKLGGFVGEGMADGIAGTINLVRRASNRMAGAAVPNANSRGFQGINTNTTPYNRFYANDSRGDSSRNGNERDRITVEVPVVLNGREIARASVDDITNEQERRRIAELRARGKFR